MTGLGKVLLIGYGNPGRLDDGLGPALAAALEGLSLPGVTVEADYQLTVEHAALAAEHEVVIFADAAVTGRAPFFFRRLEPSAELSFSTHSIEPAGVLGLAHGLFGARPRGYKLGIRACVLGAFGEQLSERARGNLAAAVGFVQRALRAGRFSDVGAAPDGSSANQNAGSNGVARCKTAST